MSRPNPRQEREDLRYQAERARPRRRISVFGYLAVLFGVAFLLLLMAYFQQQRANAETTDALKQSVSAVDTIENMVADNQALREQVAQLEEQVRRQETQQRELRARLDSLEGFRELEERFSAQDYAGCAALFLLRPDGEDGWPAQRTGEILEELFRQGTLDRDYLSHPEDYEDLVQAYTAAQS